jgi:transposase InsO family protein
MGALIAFRSSCGKVAAIQISRRQEPTQWSPLIGENRLPILQSGNANYWPEPVIDCQICCDAQKATWVTDITYITIAVGFVYMAAILDAWSRRVVG